MDRQNLRNSLCPLDSTGGTALFSESSDLFQFETVAEELVLLEPTLWIPPDLDLNASLSDVYLQFVPNQGENTDKDCGTTDIEKACVLQEIQACSSGEAAEDPLTTEQCLSGQHEQLLSAPVVVLSDEAGGGHVEHPYGKQPSKPCNERPHLKSKARGYPCSMCTFVASHPSRLAWHVRLHTGEKPHRCEVCGKCFRFRNALVLHLRTHTGERPYTCTTCGRTFGYNSTLRKHERTHIAERTYKCDVCGLKLRPLSMQRHMRTHTGERPYACTVCPAVFADKHGIKRHMLRKHPSNEQPSK